MYIKSIFYLNEFGNLSIQINGKKIKMFNDNIFYIKKLNLLKDYLIISDKEFKSKSIDKLRLFQYKEDKLYYYISEKTDQLISLCKEEFDKLFKKVPDNIYIYQYYEITYNNKEVI